MWLSMGIYLLWGALALEKVGAELFTAMADMDGLLQAEKEVVGVIDQYIHAEQNRLENLRKVAKEYQSKNREALVDGSQFLANPVNAYLLIKRLTSNWDHVESLMRHNSADEFIRNITTQRGSQFVKFPDREDLNGAAVALMRLQDTYNLRPSDIADGKLQGAKRSEELTGHDCLELARISYNQRDYYHSLLWSDEAMERMKRESPQTVEEKDVLEYLAYAMYQQGNIKRALSLTKKLYAIDPEHPRAKGNIKWYMDEMEKEGIKVQEKEELPPVSNMRVARDKEHKLYEELCRGENFKTEAELAKLYCAYKTNTPFLRLAPLKYEVVHLKPIFYVFKNVLSDYEIEVVKELASPMLKRATVKGGDGTLITVDYRIAKSAWLKSEHHPVVERINRRISDITGLSMETAEELQVANYGLGGHYEPHFDMSTRGEFDPYTGGTGNRIATLLSYMSEPEAGGATVFLGMKITLFPKKGDAAFWYNLKASGEPDLSTRHAACPVLAGVKWVSNKWIHERGQEFQRPCELDKDYYI